MELDPFERAFVALSKAGVEAIVVGMFGVNFYAQNPAETFETKDVDFLVSPTVEMAKRALVALSKEGFTFEANGEPFVDVSDEAVLQNVLQFASNIRGVFENDVVLDLMFAMKGFTFAELASDAVRFRVHGVECRVGALEKLIESKRQAGRPKDLAFLARYEAAAREPKKS